MIATQKKRWPRAAALVVAKELCDALRPVTSRLIVAGSLRRRKDSVGDVEILFIPTSETRPFDMFSTHSVDLAAEAIDRLIFTRRLAKRPSSTGCFSWGQKNKLAIHLPSGIPVDLFAATEANWWSYLVCRTGSAASNMRLATRAIERGWKWNPYGPGFSRRGGLAGPEIHPVFSEREAFDFLGLPYLEPWERL